MDDSLELLARHLIDLSRRADANNVFTFSAFLGLSEQSAFSRIEREVKIPYTLFGGTEGCERLMLRFGDAEGWGYEVPFPIVCLHVTPKERKFADALTHRDCLGALMNLGIERETLGDIVVRGNEIYLFCEEKIAPFLRENLLRIKHTDVSVSESDTVPEGELYRTETLTVTVASERLDALIAKVYNLSRDDAKTCVEKGLVFVDGREVSSGGFSVKENSVVSLRGYGRFLYRGVSGTSKKGKDVAVIEKYV